MRCFSIRARSRIEVNLIASQSPALREQPVQETPCQSLPPELGPRHDIVAVEDVTPHEKVTGSEAADGGGVLLTRQERTHQPEALGTLKSVDPIDQSTWRIQAVAATPVVGRSNVRGWAGSAAGAPSVLDHVEARDGLRRALRARTFVWSAGSEA